MTAKTTLTAPAPGTELKISATVLTAVAQTGKFYGENLHLTLRIDDGIDGVSYMNAYACVDAEGRWFTRPSQDALQAIKEGRDPSEPKAEPSKSTKTDDAKPADDNVAHLDPQDGESLDGYTVRQLKALLNRRGVTYARSMKKPELLALARDAIAETEAAA